MRTCSKTQKYSITHNFLNFDHNIGMFTSKWSYWWEEFNQIRVFEILVTQFLQLLKMKKNKNFWNLSYSVLTTTQNGEKLHISDSKCLVIVSIWTYHTWRELYRWDECNRTENVETCNENMQQNSEIFNCSQLLWFWL